jgi:hypothetical protein
VDASAHTPEPASQPDPHQQSDDRREPDQQPQGQPDRRQAAWRGHSLGRTGDDDHPHGEADDDDHDDIEAQVRAVLAAPSPDPGPMPDQVSDRIAAALAHAASSRVEPGPLARSSLAGRPSGASLLPLHPRTGRPRPVQLVAAVAAAAAVLAIGASALHLSEQANGAAAVGDASLTSRSASAATAGGAVAPTSLDRLHLQLSRTAYTSAGLPEQARRLLEHPGPALSDLAAEAPSIGPIGTPVGLQSCLEAVGALGSAPAPDAVSADLATFDGRPAAVVVVSRAGRSTAWAVARSCTSGAPGVLRGATPVP